MINRNMHDKLVKIIEKKEADIVAYKRSNHAFLNTFRNTKNIGLIAEVKLASPTIESLGSREEILDRVKAYEASGASAISIITEKHFFKGDVRFVTQVKEAVSLPILQKDFVIDESQIYEAKHIGSDALLLIARLIDGETLKHFVTLTKALGIDPVVEITNEEDLEKALATETDIIAVNARDLDTFIVDVSRACELLVRVPDTFVKLGFSGIQSAAEVEEYKKAGVHGILVGTSLMQSDDIAGFIGGLI